MPFHDIALVFASSGRCPHFVTRSYTYLTYNPNTRYANINLQVKVSS